MQEREKWQIDLQDAFERIKIESFKALKLDELFRWIFEKLEKLGK